ETQIMYVNSSELPWSLVMVDVPKKMDPIQDGARGRSVYTRNCMSCHGPELKGSGSAFPDISNLRSKYDASKVMQVIQSGQNMMPSFSHISLQERNELLDYLMKFPDAGAAPESVNQNTDGSNDRNEGRPEDAPFTMN